MNKGLRQIINAVAILLLFSSLSHAAILAGSQIINYGDKNLPALSKRFKQLEKRQSREVINVLQFGDSHTAADFFSGHLRTLLQKRYGDAGIGWITPMQIPGQYHTAVKWQNQAWQVSSSRNVERADYPMGGYVALPQKSQAALTVIPFKDDKKLWQVTLRLKPNSTPWQLKIQDRNKQTRLLKPKEYFKQWQSIQLTTTAPFTLISDKPTLELGSLFLQRKNVPGVIVSAIGSNGAQQAIWHKWQVNWLNELKQSRADLIILAYGTNEAFTAQFNADAYRQELRQSIQLIRKQLPKAVILMLSPPDTMLAKAPLRTSCRQQQPPSYAQVKRIQQQVAKQQKILYWDWQQAMGGACIIDKWRLLDLARPDLVHLTRQGYESSAELLFKAWQQLINKPK